MSDIRYCLEPELKKLLSAITDVIPQVEIELHCFENNPKACIENIKRERPPERVERELKLIAELSSKYKITKAKVIKV